MPKMKKKQSSTNSHNPPNGTGGSRKKTSSHPPPETSSGTVTREMAFYCFDVLISKLNHSPAPGVPNFTNQEFPLFVTWKKLPDLTLRGCIGTFNALPLHSGLHDYALESALKDSRFTPVALNEVKHLQVTVSLLTNFEEGEDFLDWTIGVHGIRIFHKEKGISATFLPQVASEQGWTKIQTIDALLRKGGYVGSITKEVRAGISLTRYQSDVISATYNEYDAVSTQES